MKGKGEGWLERLLLSSAFWYVLPTPATYFLNRKRLITPAQIGSMPTTDWSQRERRGLLERSEARLQNIEGKGPGGAAVTAVVAASVLIALTDGWSEASSLAKAFLVLAAFYAALSLPTAIYLVGPLKRHVIDVADLEEAASDANPEERLAVVSAEAAMGNDLQNMRLANHLDAARRELAYALTFLFGWVAVVAAGCI